MTNAADGCRHDDTPERLAELTRHFPPPRHAVSYILDTFPIVRRKDQAAHGSYRTKDTILALYDQLANAARTANPLDPPPADARCCHPAGES